MRLDFNSLLSGDREALEAYVGSIECPAAVLDKQLRLVFKNKGYSAVVRAPRIGINIKNYVSPEDYQHLCDMRDGQTLNVGLLVGHNTLGATVFACADLRILVVSRLDSDVRQGLDMLYRRMSGYDLTVVGGEEALLMRQIDASVAALFAESAAETFSLREVPFFDAVSVVRRLTFALSDRRGAVSRRIRTDIGSESFTAYGSGRDFALALGTLISLCAASSDGSIDISMSECADSVEVSVSADIYAEVADRLRKNLGRLDSTSVSEDDAGFIIYVLRLLADGNLWDLRISTESEGMSFYLTLPIQEPFSAIRLRDVGDDLVRRIIEILFK